MMIHCTIDELLAIREGEGSQGALRHLDECEECCDELELLHQRVATLKALPTVTPPRDRWDAVRGQVMAERDQRRRKFGGWLTVAAAASVALTMGVGRLVVPAVEEPDPLAELVTEVQMLEGALRDLRPERRVINGRVAGAVAVLEDRLTMLELQFTQAQQRQDSREQMIILWQQRADLMDALVNVRKSPVILMGF